MARFWEMCASGAWPRLIHSDPRRLAFTSDAADNEEVTEPQSWTLIAGFFAIMVAFAGMLLRMMRAEFRGVHVRIDGVEDRIDARFDGVNTRFDGVDARFDSMDRRIDLLGRDVQRLVGQHFRES